MQRMWCKGKNGVQEIPFLCGTYSCVVVYLWLDTANGREKFQEDSGVLAYEHTNCYLLAKNNVGLLFSVFDLKKKRKE